MAKDPAFLFYPNDWIGGTMGMTFEEKGAYMELLMLQFNRGHMTKHMIGQSVGQLFGRIEDKFLVDGEGLYYNERLEIEKQKRKTFTQSRSNNRNGTNQYSKKSGHMSNHMEDVNVNKNKGIINTKKGIKFENEKVYFEDDSFQELGTIQKALFEDGRIKPNDITKGLIN
jgi:uncharacterized protein YdaU (DUF1376 family)